MNYSIDKSFERDAKKSPKRITLVLVKIIADIKKATTISQISDIKKLKGYKNCYRIKIDDYRLGIYLEEQTIVLSRLLPRKDIYKKFP